MTIRALNDNIIVKPEPIEDMTASGLFIAGKQKDVKTERGEVVSVGPGYKYADDTPGSTDDVKVGDRVLFGRYAGAEVTHEGETYFAVPVANILGVVS